MIAFLISEYKIGDLIYEFSIVKVKDEHYYNFYGTDITDRKRQEKLKQKTDKKTILSDDRNYKPGSYTIQ